MSQDTTATRIFIADDDEDDCLLFMDVLGELDVPTRPSCFANGKELMDGLNDIKNFSEFFPDVIFLDLNMPIIGGLECLTEIKSSKTLKHLPIIIFSTSAQYEAVNAAYEKGASLYLKKPNNFPKLKEALKKILSINWKHNFLKFSREDFLMDI